MVPYYVNYMYYHPVGFVVGSPYTDPTYGWYYNGTMTYRTHSPMNPAIVIVIVVVVILILCVCCFVASKARGGSDVYIDDGYGGDEMII